MCCCCCQARLCLKQRAVRNVRNVPVGLLDIVLILCLCRWVQTISSHTSSSCLVLACWSKSSIGPSNTRFNLQRSSIATFAASLVIWWRRQSGDSDEVILQQKDNFKALSYFGVSHFVNLCLYFVSRVCVYCVSCVVWLGEAAAIHAEFK